jgi:hypothetical protein
VISFPGVVNSTAGSNESGCVPSSTTSVFGPELDEEDELEEDGELDEENELEETLLAVELVETCVEEEVVLVVELFPTEVAK